MKDPLYVNVPAKTSIREKHIRLGELCEIWCQDAATRNRWQRFVLAEATPDRHRYVFSAIDILKRIQQEDPQQQVELLGEAQVLADCRKEPSPHTFWEYVKVTIVCIITFTGGAFAIMTFNNDADVAKLFDKLYQLSMGTTSPGVTVLHWTYSLGLFVGISVFFNHLLHKKVNDDPTPLEIQMRIYEQDVTTTITQNAERKEPEVDKQ